MTLIVMFLIRFLPQSPIAEPQVVRNALECARLGHTLGTFAIWREEWCRVTTSKNWWAGTGLNRRHQDFQSCALPTELPAHQTREDSRRARGRPLPAVVARLLDGRDDAEGAGFLEEERDDDDLAGLELARQLVERDPLAAGMQTRETRRGHGDPGQRLTGLRQELGALGDRRLDAHDRVLEHPRAVD